jgi:hypothetical protein
VKRKITTMLVAGVVLVVIVFAMSPGADVVANADDGDAEARCDPGAKFGDNQPSTTDCGQPAISVSTISLDFGSVPVGTNSGPQYVTLTNTGNVPVDIVVWFSEDNPPYTVTGDNCQNLAPEQSCQVQAIFHPQKTDPITVLMFLAGRPESESLLDSKPQVVSLTGVGV